MPSRAELKSRFLQAILRLKTSYTIAEFDTIRRQLRGLGFSHVSLFPPAQGGQRTKREAGFEVLSETGFTEHDGF